MCRCGRSAPGNARASRRPGWTRSSTTERAKRRRSRSGAACPSCSPATFTRCARRSGAWPGATGGPDPSPAQVPGGCAPTASAWSFRTWTAMRWRAGFSTAGRTTCALPTRWRSWRPNSPARGWSLTTPAWPGAETSCGRAIAGRSASSTEPTGSADVPVPSRGRSKSTPIGCCSPVHATRPSFGYRRATRRDRTRDPRELDAVADFLLACGARPLDLEALAPAAPAPSALLL